jgi:hypothetical protein
MIRETLKTTGELKIVVRDQNGNVKDERHEKNLVVTAGLNVIADRMKGTPTKAAMTHMAVGTSSTAAAAGQTALVSQLGTRVSLDSTTVTANAIEYVATFPSGASTHSGALVEAGIFNASTAGDMLCRTTFAAVNKGDDDTVTITWTVTIAAP